MKRFALTALIASAAFANAMDAEQLYSKAVPSVGTIMVQMADGSQAMGTGFVAIQRDTMVTAFHVMNGAVAGKVVFSDGTESQIKGLVAQNSTADIVAFRVNTGNRRVIQLAEKEPRIGSKAYTIGAPLGQQFTLSDGIVSNLATEGSWRTVQHTCPTNHGSSGGPLLNSDGEVIGVIHGGVEQVGNINFASSATHVKAFAGALQAPYWQTLSRRTAEQPKPATTQPSRDSGEMTNYTLGQSPFQMALPGEPKDTKEDRVDGAYHLTTKAQSRLGTSVVLEYLDTPVSGTAKDVVERLEARARSMDNIKLEGSSSGPMNVEGCDGHWFGADFTSQGTMMTLVQGAVCTRKGFLIFTIVYDRTSEAAMKECVAIMKSISLRA